jgi:hypothetical protein
VIAHLIYGAVCSASQLIARSDDQRAVYDEAVTGPRTMLGALVGHRSA